MNIYALSPQRLKALCLLIVSVLVSLLLPALATADVQKKVLFLSAAHSNKAKVTLIKETLLKNGAEKTGLIVEQKAEKSIGDLSKAAKLFAEYDLVILDGVSKRESKSTYAKYMPVVKSLTAKQPATGQKTKRTRFLAINWLDNVELMQGVTPAQGKALNQYYGNGGVDNIQRMLDYMAYRIFSHDTTQVVAEPIVYPALGIYHPDASELVFDSLDAYLQWIAQSNNTELGAAGLSSFSLNKDAAGKLQVKEGQKVIGVLLQRALIESAQTQVVDDTIAQLQEKGALVVPFFFELSPFTSDYTPLITRNEQTFVDVIVNFRNIHWASKRKAEFEKLGVPVMQGLTYFDGDQKTWEADNQGISAGMTPFVLVLPEAAGVIDPFIVAAINQQTGRAQVIDYQLEHFVNKAINFANLKHKANADKRMTVMIWGSKEAGASFLNVEQSLRSISARLNDEGYSLDNMSAEDFTDNVHSILEPFYREFELDALLKHDLAELMPVAAYLSWFNTLPDNVTKPINDYWGKAGEGFMTVTREGERQFVIPRIRNGNMLIMRQPPRSDDKDEDARVFHRGEVPMNHFYLAAYYYSRQYWNSDALIHLGTHGSQEYLSGKERGLSRYDQGNLAVWDTPVLYPFIVDDVGEAMQTKRRGSATVLAHMTPPFAAAGLQGVVADLHELMHQYKSMDVGGVKEKTKQQIVADCLANNVCDDFGFVEGDGAQAKIDADFSGFIEALHEYMEDLSAQNQPLGLHSYGELPEQPLLTSTLLQMVDRSFPAEVSEFESAYFKGEGVEAEGTHEEGAHASKKGDSLEGDFANVITQLAGDDLDQLIGFKTIRRFVIEQTATTEEMIEAGLSEEAISNVQKAQAMHADMKSIKELDHLIMGLAGQYIPVKNGGDPVRTPEAVPTGYNLYGFDPSRVPTKAAFEQGRELVDDVIAGYYVEHGHYPDKLAFSLWSIETMRHYGVLESQALYAMGLRPVWSDAGRVVGTEILPASELKRPRVDVVLSATGLYRDAFPNVMQMLAKGIESVAKLKEDNNSIWDNSQRIAKELAEQGVEAGEAQYLSTVRIFSNASGRYGSGVSGPVFASDSWEDDSDIADNYMDKMGYYYGPERSSVAHPMSTA